MKDHDKKSAKTNEKDVHELAKQEALAIYRMMCNQATHNDLIKYVIGAVQK